MALDTWWQLWPVVCGGLPRPWSEAAIQLDLRWWVVAQAEALDSRPGRSGLSQRWGITSGKARKRVEDFDALGLTATQILAGRPDEQGYPLPSHSQGPPGTASLGAVKAHHNGHPQPNTTYISNTKQDISTSKVSKSVDLGSLWADLNRIRSLNLPRSGSGRAVRALKLTPPRAKALGARVKEWDRDTVVLVWRWAFTSHHQRALFLRGNGYATPETMLRPSNFPGYAEMAIEWQASQDVLAGLEDSGQGQTSSVLAAMIDSLGDGEDTGVLG